MPNLALKYFSFLSDHNQHLVNTINSIWTAQEHVAYYSDFSTTPEAVPHTLHALQRQCFKPRPNAAFASPVFPASVTSREITLSGRKPGPEPSESVLMSESPRGRKPRPTWPSPLDPWTPVQRLHSAHFHGWMCTPHYLPCFRLHLGDLGTGSQVCHSGSDLTG